MKLITRETDYALRSLCFISGRGKEIFSVAQLCAELRVPGPFLRKILQSLNKKGILKSVRGQCGGFRLAGDPSNIYLTDIMRVFQGQFRLNECFLHRLACPDQKFCPLRKKIAKIERYVFKELGAISVASLLKSKNKQPGR
ncbi:MAG: Rrf2 family transcriptional regulator [Candidatus Omnitrophota bacterium]